MGPQAPRGRPGRRRPAASADRQGNGLHGRDTPEVITDSVVAPDVFARHHEALHTAFLIVEGSLQKQPTTLTVTAKRSAVLA